MQKYKTFKISDFLLDDIFVSQHLKPTAESEKFWRESQLDLINEDYKKSIEILETIVLGLKNYENQELSEEVKTFIFEKIQKTNSQDNYKKAYSKKGFWLAAAAIILISFALLFFQKKSTYQNNLSQISEKLIEAKNNLKEDILIQLPDGSAVKLAPNSKLSYPSKFNDAKRIVILSGQATFDIVKDPSRQFLVYANEVTTKVLGTRFIVKAFENSNDVEVSVEEGKVSVYKNNNAIDKELKGVILLPNQQAVFDRQTDKYNKQIIKSPSIINKDRHTKFVFDEKSIVDILKLIQEAYGIDIEYDEALLQNCQITGSFENESLFQKLDILTQSIGGTYEIVEGKIIINARGC